MLLNLIKDSLLVQILLILGSTVCNEKYVLSQLIGNGTFGEVYKGVLTLNDSA
jgi:hypothetical protein